MTHMDVNIGEFIFNTTKRQQIKLHKELITDYIKDDAWYKKEIMLGNNLNAHDILMKKIKLCGLEKIYKEVENKSSEMKTLLSDSTSELVIDIMFVCLIQNIINKGGYSIES